ncbi:hypothetical protein MKZ38_001703 [Zalerion maritima]|uniref:BZIP domain-containing protein n=1 Tax=Zalerion maritima TaxID=339359 RepID=A0AAD5WLR9_9PEZI|nr:hypothetical protein MKZ38_001703 [Zalerion maritima]
MAPSLATQAPSPLSPSSDTTTPQLRTAVVGPRTSSLSSPTGTGTPSGPATFKISAATAPPPQPSNTPLSPSSTLVALPPKVSLRPAVASSQSPPAATHPLDKMAMSSVISPHTETPKLSMTTKEWVIPPRPKPGRKPATDTPPTKRKAQNRAAQRAFRERRAARVGELEEQIDEHREHHEKIERELRERAQGLEMELQTFKSRCVVLESMLEKERGDRAKLEAEMGLVRRNRNSGSTSSSSSTIRMRTENISGATRTASNGYAMSPTHNTASRKSQHLQLATSNRESISSTSRSEHRGSTQPFSISQIISPPDPSDIAAGCGSCGPAGECSCADEVLASATLDGGCGRCTLGSRCECLEEILSPSGMQSSSTDLKRPHPTQSPSIPPDEKRPRTDAGAVESDFTDMYSGNNNQHATEAQPPNSGTNFLVANSQQNIAPRDSCGFCEEGMYCMCAEAASVAMSQPSIASPAPISSSGPISVLGPQTQTPPPSEHDAVPPPMEVTSTGAIKLPGVSSISRKKVAPPTLPRPALARAAAGVGCSEGGPGTCAQCLSDPRSGLFCRSLAANFARQGGSAQGGCRGGSRGGRGCCKSKAEPPQMGLSLSCADAYKTLSTHKNFEQASDDIGSWLPKLKAQPIPENGRNSEGLLPIEVEAASIMSVLKEFDVRFGRGQ